MRDLPFVRIAGLIISTIFFPYFLYQARNRRYSSSEYRFRHSTIWYAHPQSGVFGMNLPPTATNAFPVPSSPRPAYAKSIGYKSVHCLCYKQNRLPMSLVAAVPRHCGYDDRCCPHPPTSHVDAFRCKSRSPSGGLAHSVGTKEWHSEDLYLDNSICITTRYICDP